MPFVVFCDWYTAWGGRVDLDSVWDLEVSCRSGWRDIVTTLANHLPIDTSATVSCAPLAEHLELRGFLPLISAYATYETKQSEGGAILAEEVATTQRVLRFHNSAAAILAERQAPHLANASARVPMDLDFDSSSLRDDVSYRTRSDVDWRDARMERHDMDVPSVGSESCLSPFHYMPSHQPHPSQPQAQPGSRLQPRLQPQSRPLFSHPPPQAPLPKPLPSPANEIYNSTRRFVIKSPSNNHPEHAHTRAHTHTYTCFVTL